MCDEIRTQTSQVQGDYAIHYTTTAGLEQLQIKEGLLLPFVKFHSSQKLGEDARN